MRIVFMGSPEFALPSLQSLVESKDVEVVAVYSQPAKKQGRKMQLKDTAIAEYAKQQGINVFTPTKLDEEVIRLKQLQPDLICVVAYGLLLPQNVLDVCPCLNVHPSSLPRFRGAAPLQHTLMAGDESADLCVMLMEAGLDTGPVFKRVHYNILADTYIDSHHDKMAQEGAKHLLDVVTNWANYKGTELAQTEDGVIYASKINKDTQKIDFNKKAIEIYNQVRGLSPVPGAIAVFDDIAYKIYQTSVLSNAGTAGEVLFADKKNGLVIACAEGSIRLEVIQKPGKSKVKDIELLNGLNIKVGDYFG